MTYGGGLRQYRIRAIADETQSISVGFMDYHVRRCTRKCCQSDRELREGESFYSVLAIEGGQLVRYDYAAEAWSGPPEEGIVGWWKSEIPTREAKRRRMAPNDVLLELFHELESQPPKADIRYVLALLLIRRRVFRLEETSTGEQGETLELYCPRLEQRFEVTVRNPEPARIEEIQTMLEGLLFAGAE